MSAKVTFKTLLAAILLAVLAFGAGYLLRGGEDNAMQAQSVLDEHAEHGLEADIAEDGNIVWTCSMHPQVQLPEPGQCPICFMDLIPLEREDDSARQSMREIGLSPEARKLAGIATEEVRRFDATVETRMVGKVDYDETRVRSITAWTGGRVDRLYIDFTGEVVKRGQPMVSIYSPELLTAQAELIQALKAEQELKGSTLELVRESAARTEQAAREKLRLLGLTPQQINRVAAEGKASDHITLYAPMGGVVIRKNVNEGQYVKTGESLYAIADLSRLWVILEAYESDLPWVELGRTVSFQTEAYPGKEFTGKVVYIDPLVNEKSRTVRVRLEVPNTDGSLKPGMLVRATQRRDAGAAQAKADAPLVIPASAPLITGKRAVVYVAVEGKDGVYEGREIVLGPRAGEFYIVRNGLEEGERVVTKGNFKIDSAVQIVARPSMMNPGTASGMAEADLPALFKSKLRLLADSFAELTQTVKTGDLSKTHLAFGSFNKELRLISAEGLEGEALLHWREYSMLLSNDAMLGAEAPNQKRLNEIFSDMREHYGELAGYFGMGDQSRAETPKAFQDQLGIVFGHYDVLSAALAQDNAEKARAAAASIMEALRGVEGSVLNGPAHNVWTDALQKMNDGLEVIRQAEDIVGVRTGFEPLSVGLAEAVAELGASTDGPVYEIFCPMAFDYEGATWLQPDQDVRNPYFGAAMLNCGEVNQQLKK